MGKLNKRTSTANSADLINRQQQVPTEVAEEDDMVDQVFERGFTFKGHLVRPARVSVRKHG